MCTHCQVAHLFVTTTDLQSLKTVFVEDRKVVLDGRFR